LQIAGIISDCNSVKLVKINRQKPKVLKNNSGPEKPFLDQGVFLSVWVLTLNNLHLPRYSYTYNLNHY